MGRISSAAYVTAVLRFLQAYNRGDLDACAGQLDLHVEWVAGDDVVHRGRADVREMLKTFRLRWSEPRARPDDFREADGNVLMVVCFYENAAQGLPPSANLRETWLVTLGDTGFIRRVVAYTSPAEGARAFEALAHRVHA
jgi:hypothetical protein